MCKLLLACAAATSLMLGGCGIRGPLYLPEVPASAATGFSDHTKPTTPYSR